MTKLVWDGMGQRRYETGVDRGVLYLPDGTGVSWNGLTSVEEDEGGIEVEPFYFDGVKYLQVRTSGDYSGTISAYTYPVEFEQFDGLEQVTNGMQLTRQPVTEMFAISYRTRIGNDVEGLDHGYKIHVVYNLTATPSTKSYSTVSDQPEPVDLSWTVSAIPEIVPGYRPTAHVIFDTTKLNPYLVLDLEDLLYGTDPTTEVDPLDSIVLDGGTAESAGLGLYDGGGPRTQSLDAVDGGAVGPAGDELDGGTPSTSGTATIDGGSPVIGTSDSLDGGSSISSDTSGPILDSAIPKPFGTPPTLPRLAELLDLVTNWVLIDIVDNGDGTWTATGPEDFITMVNATEFEIRTPTATYLDEDTYVITTATSF